MCLRTQVAGRVGSLMATQMFIQVAKEVGETCDLPPIQRLDLLVRDWQLSGAYGVDGGQEYLKEITGDLEASAEQPLVFGALRASDTQCYLLPHPGTGFTRSRAVTPGDMDEDFRQCLCDYVSTVVRSAGTHVRTDRAGQVLTGAQLATKIKGVSRDLKTKHYDFSSPMKMAESFANSRAVEAARREFEQIVRKQDRDHQGMRSCLKVKPAEMEQRLEEKRQELLDHFPGKLRGEDPQKQEALKELKQELDRQMTQFLLDYKQRFKEKAIQLGLCIGGGTLAAAGAGVGAGIGFGVAAGVAAVEEAVAIGVGVGSGSIIGGGVGSKLGAWLGEKFAWNKRGSNTPGQGEEGEDGAGCSDQEPLLRGGT